MYSWKEWLLRKERIELYSHTCVSNVIESLLSFYIVRILYRATCSVRTLYFLWDHFMSPANTETKLWSKLHAFRTQRITEPKYQTQCRLRLCTIAVSHRSVRFVV